MATEAGGSVQIYKVDQAPGAWFCYAHEKYYDYEFSPGTRRKELKYPEQFVKDPDGYRRTALIDDIGWDGNSTMVLPANTLLYHGNKSGTHGGAGMTGRAGQAVWLVGTPGAPYAPWSYAKPNGKVLIYRTREPLRLMSLQPGEQLFPENANIHEWRKHLPTLRGAHTQHKPTEYEVVVIDGNDVTFVTALQVSPKANNLDEDLEFISAWSML